MKKKKEKEFDLDLLSRKVKLIKKYILEEAKNQSTK